MSSLVIEVAIEMGVPIDMGVPHELPHFDECTVGYLLEQRHPNMRFEPMDEASAVAAYWNNPRVALIGMGHGKYDEHKEDGRLPDHCAASLAAEDLGMSYWPDMGLLISEVKRADQRRDVDGEDSGQTALEWAQWMKEGYNFGQAQGFTAKQMYPLTCDVLHCHLQGQRMQPSVRPPTPVLTVSHNLPQGVSEGQKAKVNVIAVPAYASLNELVKVWIVKMFAKERWDAKKLQVVHLDQSNLAHYALRSDVIYVGVEGGQFPPAMTPRQTAAYFGVQKETWPEEYTLLSYVLKALEEYTAPDRVVRPFELDQVVDSWNRYSKKSAEQLYNIVDKMMFTYRESALEYRVRCPAEFAKNGGVKLNIGGLTVAMVDTNLVKMAPYLRNKEGAKLAMVRVAKDEAKSHRKKGNVALFSADGYKHCMGYVAKQIVLAEARKLGWSDAKIAEERLIEQTQAIIDEGRGRNLPGPASHWFFFVEAGMLLNGSLSHYKRPTPLKEQLRRAIELAAADAGDLWSLEGGVRFEDLPTEDAPATVVVSVASTDVEPVPADAPETPTNPDADYNIN